MDSPPAGRSRQSFLASSADIAPYATVRSGGGKTWALLPRTGYVTLATRRIWKPCIFRRTSSVLVRNDPAALPGMNRGDGGWPAWLLSRTTRRNVHTGNGGFHHAHSLKFAHLEHSKRLPPRHWQLVQPIFPGVQLVSDRGHERKVSPRSAMRYAMLRGWQPFDVARVRPSSSVRRSTRTRIAGWRVSSRGIWTRAVTRYPNAPAWCGTSLRSTTNGVIVVVIRGKSLPRAIPGPDRRRPEIEKVRSGEHH